MSYRFTDTEKWKDRWFVRLKPFEKLIFIYMCDNCDMAGFYEIDTRKMAFDIGTPEDEIIGALKGIDRGFIGPKTEIKDGDEVWIKNFIKHQSNFPINPENKAHRSIIRSIKEHQSFIPEILEYFRNNGNNIGAIEGLVSPLIGAIKELPSPTSISISISKEEKKEELPASKADRLPPPKSLFDIYNRENYKLPNILQFTKNREDKCRSRIRSHARDPDAFLKDFSEAIRQSQMQPFMYGDNDRNWSANFDWFIANDTNYVKVLEGKFRMKKTQNEGVVI